MEWKPNKYAGQVIEGWYPLGEKVIESSWLIRALLENKNPSKLDDELRGIQDRLKLRIHAANRKATS